MAGTVKEYEVTKGNFVADADGQKGQGEKVKFTEAQAKPLKEAGLIK